MRANDHVSVPGAAAAGSVGPKGGDSPARTGSRKFCSGERWGKAPSGANDENRSRLPPPLAAETGSTPPDPLRCLSSPSARSFPSPPSFSLAWSRHRCCLARCRCIIHCAALATASGTDSPALVSCRSGGTGHSARWKAELGEASVTGGDGEGDGGGGSRRCTVRISISASAQGRWWGRCANCGNRRRETSPQ